MTHPSQKIVFTGGGSAGHVTPNIALIQKCLAQGFEVCYIGSISGIEKDLITPLNLPYFGIANGRLRRYLTWKNMTDPFKTVLGIAQAYWLLWKLKPQLVFSKGGFVAFPVVVAAWLNKIPVVIHESDLTPGLANKMSFPFAKKICLTFNKTQDFFKNKTKLEVTGTPIRQGFFQGDAEKGRKFCGFADAKPVILVVGGGLGSQKINETIHAALPELLAHYYVVHLCGKGKTHPHFDHFKGYRQFEYLHDELYDVMACAAIVISRAGANSLYELLVLKKPHILIPLSTLASRGDQVDNAAYFAAQGVSKVIAEEALQIPALLATIAEIHQQLAGYQTKLRELNCNDATPQILNVIHHLLPDQK